MGGKDCKTRGSWDYELSIKICHDIFFKSWGAGSLERFLWRPVYILFEFKGNHTPFANSRTLFPTKWQGVGTTGAKLKRTGALFSVALYIKGTEECKKTKSLKVKEMEAKDFIDTFKGALFKNLTKPIDNWGENFNWNLILEFAFENRLFKLVL